MKQTFPMGNSKKEEKTMEQHANEMPKGIRNLFTSITHYKKGEKILIITDDNKMDIGQLVYRYAKQMAEDVAMAVMEPRKGHGSEPPKAIAEAMLACDICLGATTMSLYHSQARNTACREKGMRWVGLQDFVPEMFETGGMTADFDEIRREIDRVAHLYEGKRFHLTAPGGTDMTCSVEGRKVVVDYGTAITPGAACGTPNAEIALGPVEGTAEGILVIDGSIPHPLLNVIEEPITCRVEKGAVTEITGGRQAKILKQILEEYKDPTVYNVAELGLGMNPLNEIIGHMAPDEGSYGNIHVGIGKNTGFGGHVMSPLHLDMVVRKITAEIDGNYFMKDGVLMV